MRTQFDIGRIVLYPGFAVKRNGPGGALRTEHIARFRLPTEPPKKTDSRTKNWQGGEACQLEALPPDVLAGLLDATIKTYLNLAILEEDLEADPPSHQRLTKALPAPQEDE